MQACDSLPFLFLDSLKCREYLLSELCVIDILIEIYHGNTWVEVFFEGVKEHHISRWIPKCIQRR